MGLPTCPWTKPSFQQPGIDGCERWGDTSDQRAGCLGRGAGDDGAVRCRNSSGRAHSPPSNCGPRRG